MEEGFKMFMINQCTQSITMFSDYSVVMQKPSGFCDRIQFKGDLVSACPDVSQVSLGKDEEFLILASDGLWDYISRFTIQK